MIFESHFPVGFLDFVIWSPLGESENFIIVLAHGDSKYWWLRLGFFWSQSNKHCMYIIWCLCVLVGSVFVNIGYCGCHYTRMVPLFLHVRANLRISQLSRDFLLASYCFPAVDIVRIVCMDYIWKKAITVFVRFVTTNMKIYAILGSWNPSEHSPVSHHVDILSQKIFYGIFHLFDTFIHSAVSRIAVVRSEKYLDIPAAAPVTTLTPLKVQI